MTPPRRETPPPAAPSDATSIVAFVAAIGDRTLAARPLCLLMAALADDFLNGKLDGDAADYYRAQFKRALSSYRPAASCVTS